MAKYQVRGDQVARVNSLHPPSQNWLGTSGNWKQSDDNWSRVPTENSRFTRGIHWYLAI